ncbi:MAG: zinc ribbon domain-containing protein, partial [Armatimonadetes bacterium]|nr:zinc ribbon domain-containing protein [Armatimonadota bacterium]
MNPCWNCEQSRPEDTRFCSTCGYPLRPEPYEVTGFLRGIEYLEREMRRWEWLDDARRASLAEHYAERRARLKPSQMRPPGPAPEPAPQPSQGVAEPTETLVDTFTGFLEERNIRWFQILGGLLLLAGFIGFLRMQWGAIGAFVISAILVGAPILVFHGAFRLRQTLPISSRMLSITGGLLTPIALLALHRYLPQISWQDWSAISFAISAGVLLFLSVRLEEIACLYLGSLSLALAAACAQASPSVAFGGCMLAAAFGYLAAARSGRAPAPFAPHLRALSQILATVGLLGTLPMLGGREIAGPLVFFCGAAFFATFSYLLHDVRALYGSAVAAIGLAAFLAASLSLPQIALLFLALGAVYLTLARTLGDPADEIADASVRLGVGLVAVALVALLGIDLLRAIVDGFQALPRETLAWTVLVALASALYYTIAAVVFGSPRLIYGATAGLAYAEIVAVAWLQHPGAQWIPLTMALFPLAVLLLRPVVPARWLAPALEAATWIALVPGPLALLQWAADVPEAARLTPWTALILALFYLLSAAWTRRPSLLYFGALWTFVGYVSFLKPGLAAYGLALLPLAATLAVAALAVDRRHGRAFALPLARSAWVLAVVVLAAQYVLWMSAERGGVPQTLLLAALGFAALARPFAAWTLGAGPAD